MANLIKLFKNLKITNDKSLEVFGDLIVKDFHKVKYSNPVRTNDLLFLAYKFQVTQLEALLEETTFNLNTLTMTIKYHISNTSGRWLINGKKYQDLNPDEKNFFDEFLKQTKLDLNPQK